MWPDRVSNLGPLTYESGVLQTALRGPAETGIVGWFDCIVFSASTLSANACLVGLILSGIESLN